MEGWIGFWWGYIVGDEVFLVGSGAKVAACRGLGVKVGLFVSTVEWEWVFRVAVMDELVFVGKRRVGSFRAGLDGGVGIWMWA